MFFVSCAGLGNDLVKSPRINVSSIKINEIRLDKQDIMISLNIFNPNPVPIPVRGLTYQLDINDVLFASGFNNTRMDIPASGEENVDLSISGDLISFLLKNQLAGKGSLNYSLTGDVALISSSIKFPYSRSGQIKIPDYINNIIGR